MFRKLAVLTSLLVCLVGVRPMHAQSTPALSYVPAVTNYAGGATTSTICSNATDTIGDGCVATSAALSGPATGDSDAAGNIYFPDFGNNVIRRIDALTGVVTVVAGQPYLATATAPAVCSGHADTIGDGCLATEAVFNDPKCVRFDRNGDLVIADVGNQVIRRIDHTTGIITVLMGEVGTAKRISTPANSKPLTPLTTLLDNPYIVIFDPAGNMFVENSTGDSLLMAAQINGVVDPVNSPVYTVAGTGVAASSAATDGNGGPAINATLLTSRGLALDAAGNVYIGDYGDDQVRKVASAGANGQFTVSNLNAALITNLLGTGTAGTTGNGGLGTAAETASPQGLGFDNAGTLYVEQYSSGNDYIRTLNVFTDIVNAYAGTGPATETGDNGAAAAASFYTPTAIKPGVGGQMIVFDTSNNRIRNIFPTPFFSAASVGASASQNAIAQANAAVTPTTMATSNTQEFAVGTLSGCSLGASLSASGYCTIPLTFTPAKPGLRTSQLTITDSNGKVYIDPVNGIGFAPAASFLGAPISTLAGTGTAGYSAASAAAATALVSAPRGGAVDALGNYFFADTGNNVVREINASSGMIATVAGNGSQGFSGDGGAATSAALSAPAGVAVDAAGNIYIADSGNNRIRRVDAATGVITTIAGTSTAGYAGDANLASAASLNNPTGIALDTAGVLYVADSGNHALRAFSINNGVIVTLAGTGTLGYSGDGGVPQLAKLNGPTGVTVDLKGNIFVADTGNAVIRKVTPLSTGIINFQATISTFAGVIGGSANTGDGGAATSASLLTPSGLGTDAAGDLYIAAGNQVRMVSATGIISKVAGSGVDGSYAGDGANALNATLPAAQGIAVDGIGNVYLADTAGNRILSIAGSSAAAINFGYQTYNTSSLPRTATIYNSGNQPLVITSISLPAAYSLASTSSSACSSSITLQPGGSCTLTITFNPTAIATYNGAITITDNSLNGASSTQTIALQGVAVEHLNDTTTTVTYSPSVPTLGQPLTVTATVSGTPTPTGTVNFLLNGTTIGTGTLDATGKASIPVNPVVGTNTVTVNYLGDANDANSSGTASFKVGLAVLTVTATNQSIYPTQAVPAFTYTITGFIGNDSAATSVTGVPAITTTATSSSAPGNYPIVVAQGTLSSPTYTFNFVNGTLTVVTPTFTLGTSASSLVIPTGQVGSTTLTVTPSVGYNGNVKLSCGSLPSDIVCTFTANTLTVDPSSPESTLLTISANQHPEIASAQDEWLRRGGAVSLAFALLPLGWLGRKRRSIRALLGIALTASLLSILSGCGQGNRTAQPYTGTLTVTATDSASGAIQTTTIALTVQ